MTKVRMYQSDSGRIVDFSDLPHFAMLRPPCIHSATWCSFPEAYRHLVCVFDLSLQKPKRKGDCSTTMQSGTAPTTRQA